MATGPVNHEDDPGKIKRNISDPIFVIFLARLAIDQSHRRKGLGTGLLKDALLRVLNAAEEIGVRAVLTHALDEDARSFYLKHGFYASPNHQKLWTDFPEPVITNSARGPSTSREMGTSCLMGNHIHLSHYLKQKKVCDRFSYRCICATIR